MPDIASTRYEQYDAPLFTAKMKDLCADCEVLYQNANADAAVDGDLAPPQSPERKRGGSGNVSKTGANNAPLGARRQRVPAAASPRPDVGGDPDEIDLGEDDEDAQETSSTHVRRHATSCTLASTCVRVIPGACASAAGARWLTSSSDRSSSESP